MTEENKCDVCQKAAIQKCGGCHLIYYCCKEHQKTGWKFHKTNCRPFKVCENEKLGRYLVASKEIKAGEVIIKEVPLIWGPAQITIPVCLGCGKALDEKNAKPCQKCGWPMCSELCKNSPSHIPECSYTMKRGDMVSIKNFNMQHPSYQCITVLRCLYQKHFLPNVWEKISRLESHVERRKLTPLYAQDKRNIADFIRRFFKLDKFTDEEILDICGILTINGHEVPLNDPPHVAVYEMTSMLEHSCKANCYKSFMSNGGVVISAGINIEKGDHLSICYTDPLWGTQNRRHHLYETKYFWCNCQRCSDPTEFATYFSALKCQDGDCSGYLLPKTFLEDLQDEQLLGDWHCGRCKRKVSSEDVHEILEKLGRKLQAMPKGDSDACKAFLNDNEKYLPQSHFYMIDVKYALSQLIGQEGKEGLPGVSDDDLQLKTKLCKQLGDMIQTLIPSEKRILGLILFELHASIAEIGRRKVHDGTGGPLELQNALLESKKVLLQVTELLKHEPPIMPEGKILHQAKLNLEEIDVILRTVHTTIGDSPI